MRSLGLVVVLSLALVAACEGRRRPDMLAVVVESFGQADCAPVPLQLVDVRSGTIRLGPSDRWVSVAVSPSGNEVAAVRMDYNLCGPDGPEADETFTLVTIDVETLEVTEHRTGPEIVGHIHWSPDERHLLLNTGPELLLLDLESEAVVRREEAGGNSGGQRFTLIWPETGRYILLFVRDLAVVGFPHDTAAVAGRWEPDCDRGGASNPVRLRSGATDHIVVDHYCTDSRTTTLIWKTVIDLSADAAAPRAPSPEGERWLNETVAWYGAADEPFSGGISGSSVFSLSGDTSRRLLFTTVLTSPSGADLHELRRLHEPPSSSDVETTIVIRDLDGISLRVPVALRYPSPTGGSGPLLDVAILD